MKKIIRTTHSRYSLDLMAGLLILAFVGIFYISTVKFSMDFNQTIVPRGDPFSYNVSFFSNLDYFHSSGFIKNVLFIIHHDWYWLMNFMLLIFSPFLIKEPYSIAMVNFVMFAAVSLSLFRLGRCLKFSTFSSLILSLIIWLYPSNYGFRNGFSLYVTQLDTLFLWAVTAAVLNAMIYGLDITKTRNAVTAGVLTGLAVWGRGNSLPYVFMAIIYPLGLVVYQLFRSSSRKSLLNLFLYCLIALLMSGIFLILNYKSLFLYYAPHLQISRIHNSGLEIPIFMLKRYPGALWGVVHANEIYNFVQTILMHVVMLLGFYMSRNSNKDSNAFRQFAIKRLVDCGLIIFYGTLIFNLMILRSKAEIYDCPPFETMLAGLTLSIGAIILIILTNIESRFRIIKWLLVVGAFILVLTFGIFISKSQVDHMTPEPGAALPKEVEKFATHLESILNNKSLCVLWYELYNQPLLNYYRIEDNLSIYGNFYRNSYWDSLWMQGWHAPGAQMDVRLGLNKAFTEADFIIIPEFLDSYLPNETYGLYVYKEEVARYLNSPQSPKFVVRMVLHDALNIRLLLLQRKDKSLGQGEDLKLPYGPKPVYSGINYLNVISDKS